MNEHAEAVKEFGYSQREAAFVALAALHSGYFLARQFAPAATPTAHNLCRKVLRYEHATVGVYAHNTKLYHLQSKALYRALGQEDNRHRREQEAYRVRAKLMGLDYVLLNPEFRYLPTEQEKLDYFCDERGLPIEALPSTQYVGEGGKYTQRFFIDKFPIRVTPNTNEVAFCYMDAGVFADIAFPSWLAQYSSLIGALGSAEIVYVATSDRTFGRAERQFRKAFPYANIAASGDLLDYFTLRSSVEESRMKGWPQDQIDQYSALMKRFSAPAFEAQYAAWKSPERADKQAGVRLTNYILPYSYSWLGSASKD